MKPRTRLVALHPVHGYAIPPPMDVKVTRRNARERNRVQSVNAGFDLLKRHIPSAAATKKMSKVNILSHAVNYIEALTSLLREAPPLTSSSSTASPSPFPPPEPSPSSSYTQPCYTHPSYPPPLTPISPNTHPYYQGFRHYESGYDTSPSGFYSEPELHPANLGARTSELRTSELPSSEVSHPASIGARSHSWAGEVQSRHYPSYPSPPCTPALPVHPAPTTTSSPASIALKVEQEESSGEEDDILDAIAEWQEVQ